ncbi:hypothetical protein EYC84_007966 [Monilinia fructicola]|uniref:Enoyl reductase (ER) domain-containing protein n=1 Tax=Monilinia fructicola TaxID=38448 RepID=A0A5M9JJT0_MONFR|nr:hypothetical protein EYC84_007966 [Monilinia fructicola]
MASPDLPRTIKSLIQPDIHSSKLILTEIPTPTITPGSTEHLIRVQSTSPCAGELTWAANIAQYVSISPDFTKYNTASEKLQVPCYDLSGTVVLAPPGSPFPPGTEVYTRTSFARPGNAREYTIALQEELAQKPKNISWEEAASIPLSAFTAWQALYLGEGGRVVSIKEDPNNQKPTEGVADDVEGKFFVMEPEGWQLEETAGLIEKGQVKAIVDSVWPLRDFEKAFEIVEGGHAKGKVIINVRE